MRVPKPRKRSERRRASNVPAYYLGRPASLWMSVLPQRNRRR